MQLTDDEKKNLLIDEFTSVSPVTCELTDRLMELKVLMSVRNIRHLPVCDNGKVVGVLSERDLHALSFNQLEELKAQDMMVTNILTAQRNDLLRDVVYAMNSKKIGSALITDERNKLYGVFTSTDALNTVVELLN